MCRTQLKTFSRGYDLQVGHWKEMIVQECERSTIEREWVPEWNRGIDYGL